MTTKSDYWLHNSSTMECMGFSSCKADPNARMYSALKANGVKCYQHVLLCTDDVLAIVEEPERFIIEELVK